MLPLARDQHGNAFEVPPEAAFWRVKRQTGGRPSRVLGPDNEPLYIPIGGDRLDLHANGCSGSLRLEAVDGDYHPVEAPVAYVDVASSEAPAPRNAATTDGNADLVRTSFESMTRVMEAMQRAQVERERAQVEKDRAATEAQVAMQRNNVEIMLMLADRATGGKPQDPVAVLEQHVKLQKVIDRQGGQRNAGLLMPASTTDADDKQGGGKPSWMAALLPWTPLAAQMVAKMIGKNDKKAMDVARNSNAIVNGVTALQNDDPSGVDTLTQGIIGSIQSAIEPDGAPESAPVAQPIQMPIESNVTFVRPRAVREVLAHLDDEAAERFDAFLDTLDGDSFDRVTETGASIPDIGERAQWARQLIGEHASAESGVPAPTATLPEIPPSLIPAFVQLTPEERAIGAQLLLKLDRASVDAFIAKLVAMPTDKAVRTVRQAIAEADRRSASIAHRAIHAAMSSDDDAVEGAVS